MFSIKKSANIFWKAQLWLMIFGLILLSNFNYWENPKNSILGFFLFGEFLIVLLAFLTGFKTTENFHLERNNPFRIKGFLKSAWVVIPVVLFVGFAF